MKIACKEIRFSTKDDREYVRQIGMFLKAAGFEFAGEKENFTVTPDSTNKIRNDLGVRGEENAGHSHKSHSEKEHQRETEKELPGVVMARSVRAALERAEGLKIEYTEEELKNKELQQTMQQIGAARALVSGLDRKEDIKMQQEQDRLLQHEKKAELVKEKQRQVEGKENVFNKAAKDIGEAFFLVLAPDHWVDAYIDAQHQQNKERGILGQALKTIKTGYSLISDASHHEAKKPSNTPPGTLPAREPAAEVLPFSGNNK